MKWIQAAVIIVSMALASVGLGQTVVVKLYRVAKTGHGQFVGTVTAKDTQYGLLLTPDLTGLKPGLHAFHLHVEPNCSDFGKAAGGHLDPYKTNRHAGPYSDKGHLGDLPALCVSPNGDVTTSVLAPRLKVVDILGHSMMIHMHGDNHSDVPKKYGGGGPRVICGVVPTVASDVR